MKAYAASYASCSSAHPTAHGSRQISERWISVSEVRAHLIYPKSKNFIKKIKKTRKEKSGDERRVELLDDKPVRS